MEDRKEALEEFLKSLRVVLINTSIYREGHPVFTRSIRELKDKLDRLLFPSSYIEIGIKPDALIIEGKIFKDSKLYKDIARFFHLRMVMSVRIEEGITEEELASFSLQVTDSPQRIIESGGIKKLVEKKMIKNLIVRELDYSPLLAKSAKTSSVDIWDFLLKETKSLKLKRKDADTFLKNFGYILEKADFTQLLHHGDLRKRLKKVVSNVKKELVQRREELDKNLLKIFLRKKEQMNNKQLLDLGNSILEGISPNTAVEALWEEVFGNKNFSPLAFSVFDRLIDRNKKEEIFSLWRDKLAEGEIAKDPLIRNKVKELLVLEEEDIHLPKIYYDTLSFFAQQIHQENRFMFDRSSLFKNYIYVLLNTLSPLQDIDSATILFTFIFENWDKIKELNDFDFLRYLCDAIEKSIKTTDDSLRNFLEEKKKHLFSLIEGLMIEKISKIEEKNFNYFQDCIEKSCFEYTYYLEKIGNYHDPRGFLTKLFYKFFPDRWEILISKVKKNASNARLVTQVINALKEMGSIKASYALKEIFYCVNPLLKLEIIRVLKSFPSVEKEFILDNLKSGDFFIKKESIEILKSKDKELRREGAKVLLNIFNPLGINNRYLIENIRLIGEMRLKEAEEFLHPLLKKKILMEK